MPHGGWEPLFVCLVVCICGHPSADVDIRGPWTYVINFNVIITFNLDGDLTEHDSVEDHQHEIEPVTMSVEQRIYNAMKDEKNVRKQFENKMKTEFETAKEHTEIELTNLRRKSTYT